MSEKTEALEKRLRGAKIAHLIALNPKTNEPLLRKRVQELESELLLARAEEGKNVPTKEGQQSARKLAGGKA